MIEIKVVLALLVTHWIADFVLQSDWMAQNKSKDWAALSSHVTVYTITLWGSVGLGLGPRLMEVWLMLALYAGVNGILHFITDAITSRINSRLWAAKQVHYFFVSIGFDQLIHYFTLILTYVWLLQS